MLIIWTPSSFPLATSAYIDPPIPAMAMPAAPSSSVKPPSPSVRAATATGPEGSVMLIIWTPSSTVPDTTAYASEPIHAVTMPAAPSSSVKPPSPSVRAATATGPEGSVMLII